MNIMSGLLYIKLPERATGGHDLATDKTPATLRTIKMNRIFHLVFNMYREHKRVPWGKLSFMIEYNAQYICLHYQTHT